MDRNSKIGIPNFNELNIIYTTLTRKYNHEHFNNLLNYNNIIINYFTEANKNITHKYFVGT